MEASEAIRVILRVRPPIERELHRGFNKCLSVNKASQSVTLNSRPSPKTFHFDQVISPDDSQLHVFQTVGRPISDKCLQGYNGTIFAYGQTGSGKTYTVQGIYDQDKLYSPALRSEQCESGLMPRVFEYIFNGIAAQKRAQTAKRSQMSPGSITEERQEFLCTASFLEIYNDRVFDLLEPGSMHLQLREDITRGVFVAGLSEETVHNTHDVLKVMQAGILNRRVGETAMNRQSSRSHSVFTMYIHSETHSATGIATRKTSRFHLIDLAGSERQKDTHATGERLKEASKINRSLSALSNVIHALVDCSQGKRRHVHYRDSKLTFLLRDSLGGNALTYIIACASPAAENFGETLSTLKFAQRAKMVKNCARVNEEDHTADLKVLRDENTRLRAQLSLLAQQQKKQEENTNPQLPRRFNFFSSKSFLRKPSNAPSQENEKENERALAQMREVIDGALERERHCREETRRVQEMLQAALSLNKRNENKHQSLGLIVRLRDQTIARLKSQQKPATQKQRSGVDVEAVLKENEELRNQLQSNPEVQKKALEVLSLKDQVFELRKEVARSQKKPVSAIPRNYPLNMRVQLQKAEAECCRLSQQLADSVMKDPKVDLEAQEKKTKEVEDRLNDKIAQLEEDVNAAKSELENMDSKLARSKQRKCEMQKKLTKELEDLKERLATADEEYANKHCVLSQQLAKAHEDNNQMQSELRSNSKHLNDVIDALQSVRLNLKARCQRVAELQRSCTSLQESLVHREAECSHLQSQCNLLEKRAEEEQKSREEAVAAAEKREQERAEQQIVDAQDLLERQLEHQRVELETQWEQEKEALIASMQTSHDWSQNELRTKLRQSHEEMCKELKAKVEQETAARLEAELLKKAEEKYLKKINALSEEVAEEEKRAQLQLEEQTASEVQQRTLIHQLEARLRSQQEAMAVLEQRAEKARNDAQASNEKSTAVCEEIATLKEKLERTQETAASKEQTLRRQLESSRVALTRSNELMARSEARNKEEVERVTALSSQKIAQLQASLEANRTEWAEQLDAVRGGIVHERCRREAVQRECNEAIHKWKLMDKELKIHQAETWASEQQCAKLVSVVENLQREQTEWHMEKEALRDQISDEKQHLAEMKSNNEIATRRIDQLQSKLHIEEQRAKCLEADLQTANAQIAKLGAALEQKTKNYISLKALQAQRAKRMVHLELLRDHSVKKSGLASKETKSLQNALRSKTQALTQLQKSVESQRSEVNKLLANIEAKEIELDRMRTEVEQKTECAESEAEEKEFLKTSLDETRAKLATALAERTELAAILKKNEIREKELVELKTQIQEETANKPVNVPSFVEEKKALEEHNSKLTKKLAQSSAHYKQLEAKMVSLAAQSTNTRKGLHQALKVVHEWQDKYRKLKENFNQVVQEAEDYREKYEAGAQEAIHRNEILLKLQKRVSHVSQALQRSAMKSRKVGMSPARRHSRHFSEASTLQSPTCFAPTFCPTTAPHPPARQCIPAQRSEETEFDLAKTPPRRADSQVMAQTLGPQALISRREGQQPLQPLGPSSRRLSGNFRQPVRRRLVLGKNPAEPTEPNSENAVPVV